MDGDREVDGEKMVEREMEHRSTHIRIIYMHTHSYLSPHPNCV